MSSKRAQSDAALIGGFLPPVGEWFRRRFGEATEPQRRGWPSIGSGRNTLIVAPTGSGKTLAAFLACLDRLWREDLAGGGSSGVGLLYVSPLKALNADIARNLKEPLEGILDTAVEMGIPLRPLRVAVRTGDTPAAERARLVHRPPDVLITTPESLHLMLTSRARACLRNVRYVVVDEIHALCGNKRGVFLSLLLERLARMCSGDFVRVGLSATQRPLDEVARFLGGRATSAEGFAWRPVEIVDAGRRKELELDVVLPELEGDGGSVWPAIGARLAEEVRAHRSTIVFTNNRRATERLAAALNDRLGGEEGYPVGSGARPHHGSLSLEVRRGTEELLKRGELQCVVATASLELGIDMGAVDLVCQVESPGGVARGLQRVGRAGHVVGYASRGKLYAKTKADLLELAALARAMMAGEVEALRVPQNCLDVLAQQVVACVAVEDWSSRELFDLVRRSYAYRDLSWGAFERVLAMLSGRLGGESRADFRDLRPRIHWDVAAGELRALPGSAKRALLGGGTIPDSGRYPLQMVGTRSRLGELDEEFVLERRAGETFRLGHATWRIEAIEPHRVLVSPAPGHAAMVPFWRGEAVGRSPELGEAVGAVVREALARLDVSFGAAMEWLRCECRLEESSARRLLEYLARQRAVSGAVPDDGTILVESFVDPVGETGIAVLTTGGARLHHALKIILQARLRRMWGVSVAAMHGDDGVLLRVPGMDEPPLELFVGLTPALGEELLREELADTPLFGLRFRQNAGRALLIERPAPGKRSPLWLQRLRARDLLQALRRVPEHPIVLETLRECLDDDLELPRVRSFLEAIHEGRKRVVCRAGETPSPWASELIFEFTHKYLYEWDDPKPLDRPPDGLVRGGLLDELLAGARLEVAAAAVERLRDRARGGSVVRAARSDDELIERLRWAGELSPSELAFGDHAGMARLIEGGRAMMMEWPSVPEPLRWIDADTAGDYLAAFGGEEDVRDQERRRAARARVLERFLSTMPLATLEEVCARYPLSTAEGETILKEMASAGVVARVERGDGQAAWGHASDVAEARRITLALRRRESVAVLPAVFIDHVMACQYLRPGMQRTGEAGLAEVLERLQGYAAPLELWREEILPARVPGFRGEWLAGLVDSGACVAAARDGGPGAGPRVAFLGREFAAGGLPAGDREGLSPREARVSGFLEGRGALYVEQIAAGVGLPPSEVRGALQGLLRRGLAVADRLEAFEGDEDPVTHGLRAARAGRPRRLLAGFVPRARWSEAAGVVDVGPDGVAGEEWVACWVAVLMGRWGVLSRQTAALDAWAPPWSVLSEYLARAELRGEVRRGYFVEGLAGPQFALPAAADALAVSATRAGLSNELMMISSCDPANIHGPGGIFDLTTERGEPVRPARVAGNYLVVRAGHPVLSIEGRGRRLRALAGAREQDLRAAMGMLPSLSRAGARRLKVESYNDVPAHRSEAAEWLEAVGFVHEYPVLAYYGHV